jgi:hypothetical protein
MFHDRLRRRLVGSDNAELDLEFPAGHLLERLPENVDMMLLKPGGKKLAWYPQCEGFAVYAERLDRHDPCLEVVSVDPSIAGTSLFLESTGYPQLGNAG